MNCEHKPTERIGLYLMIIFIWAKGCRIENRVMEVAKEVTEIRQIVEGPNP